MNLNRNMVIAAAAVVVIGGGAGGYFFWKQYEASLLPAGIVATNGRVEATQVDIATKIPGRVVEIIPHEGDMVSPGEVLARIDTSETLPQLQQAQAAAALARQTVATREAAVASDEAANSCSPSRSRPTSATT
jgi:HlyD family secretion protein